MRISTQLHEKRDLHFHQEMIKHHINHYRNENIYIYQI